MKSWQIVRTTGMRKIASLSMHRTQQHLHLTHKSVFYSYELILVPENELYILQITHTHDFCHKLIFFNQKSEWICTRLIRIFLMCSAACVHIVNAPALAKITQKEKKIISQKSESIITIHSHSNGWMRVRALSHIQSRAHCTTYYSLCQWCVLHYCHDFHPSLMWKPCK